MAPLKFSICVPLTVGGEAMNSKNSTALVDSAWCIGIEPARVRGVWSRECSVTMESRKVGDAAVE